MHINIELKNRLFQNLYFFGSIKSWKRCHSTKNYKSPGIYHPIQNYVYKICSQPLTEIIQSCGQFQD